MSSQEHNRRVDDQGNWFVRAGSLTRNIKFILTIFTLLLAASLLFQVTGARSDTAQLTDLLERADQERTAIQEQADLIIDCTQPSGECFKEGQKRTAEVVAGLNVVTQYSVICGEREDGEQEILACVNREVEDYLRVTSQQNKNG